MRYYSGKSVEAWQTPKNWVHIKDLFDKAPNFVLREFFMFTVIDWSDNGHLKHVLPAEVIPIVNEDYKITHYWYRDELYEGGCFLYINPATRRMELLTEDDFMREYPYKEGEK